MTRNDVLIIGAGPSGLFAAAELARHGVQARLIERQTRSHREARATAIQPGTLEILDSVGLLQPFLDAAEHVRCSRLYGPGMSEVEKGPPCICGPMDRKCRVAPFPLPPFCSPRFWPQSFPNPLQFPGS